MGSERDCAPGLDAALSALAAEDAAALMREARQVAIEQVRVELAGTYADALRRAVAAELAGAPAPRTQPPAPRAASTGAASADAAAAAFPTALYVYGVVRGSVPAIRELPLGVGDQSEVLAIAEGELSALVSEVDLADFEEETLRAHLADLAWVEATARRHEEVLAAICEQLTVVPMRMCTVYRQAEGLRELLRREEGALTRALEYLEGRREWGVKAYGRPAAPEPAAEPGEASGTAYMQRRLRERTARTRASELAEKAAAEAHEQLAALAVDAVLATPQAPEVSGREAEMLLNGVYLVAREDEGRFSAAVDALAAGDDGLELELTGPWPPYNFVPGGIGATW